MLPLNLSYCLADYKNHLLDFYQQHSCSLGHYLICYYSLCDLLGLLLLMLSRRCIFAGTWVVYFSLCIGFHSKRASCLGLSSLQQILFQFWQFSRYQIPYHYTMSNAWITFWRELGISSSSSVMMWMLFQSKESWSSFSSTVLLNLFFVVVK